MYPKHPTPRQAYKKSSLSRGPIFLCAVLSFLMLTGCASNIKPTAIDLKQGIPADHGVVAVQVISNAERLGQHNKDWTEIFVVRLDNIEYKKAHPTVRYMQDGKKTTEWEPDFYSLTPNSEGMITSQIFIGSMPAGTYTVTKLFAYYATSEFSSYLSMPVGSSAGIFEVKAGRMTNLGSIVFQPLENIKQDTFWTGKSSNQAYVSRVQTNKDVVPFITQRYPSIEAKIDLNNALGWRSDGLDPIRKKLNDLSRENAFGNHVFKLSRYGKGLMASRLGLIHWVDQNDQWHRLNMETHTEVQAVLEMPDKILLGGELGTVFVSDRLNGTWSSFKPVSPLEGIIWMGGNENGYYAVTRKNDTHFVYRVTPLTQPWERIGEFRRVHVLFSNNSNDVFPIVTRNNLLRIFTSDQRRDFDPKAKTWSVSKSDVLLKLARTSDSALVGVEFSSWDGVGDQVISYDDGITWQPLPRSTIGFATSRADTSFPALIGGATFVSVGTKPSVADDNASTLQKQTAPPASPLHIIKADVKTFDGAKSWQYLGELKSDCNQLMPQISSATRLYFLCDQGGLVYTEDNGAHWQTAVALDLDKMRGVFNELIDAAKKTEK